MLHSIWQGIVLLLKGVVVVAAILGILGLGVLIWFSTHPLFPTPTTGALHATAVRELRLHAGQTTVAVRLDARLNANALPSSSARPGPPGLHAALAPLDGSTLAGVTLRVVPMDVPAPLSGIRETTAGLDWTIPCPATTGEGCGQRVILLLDADPAPVDRRWTLTVNGDLAYPLFTQTPGGSSFDLALGAVGEEAGTGPSSVAAGDGELDLTVERPVVIVPVHVEHGGTTAATDGTPRAALGLSVDAVRLTQTAPAGLEAAEPVRATVLGADGAILAREGVRPGQGGRNLAMAIAACAAGCVTDYWVAFEWMDRRPDAEYRVTWRAEALGLPANDGPPELVAITADAPQSADPAGTTDPARPPDPGEGLGMQVHIGGLPGADAGGSALHVQLLVTVTVAPAEHVGMPARRIQIRPAFGRELQVPFDVSPGQTGSLVVNPEDGCEASRCDAWGLSASPNATAGPGVGSGSQITWLLEARAWRLVPGGGPVVMSLEVT